MLPIMLVQFIPIVLSLSSNGMWTNYTMTSPTGGTNGIQAIVCSLQNITWNGTPFFFSFMYFVIYLSVMIFFASTEGKFIRFAYASFAMIFVAIPFTTYGCGSIPLMSQNIIVYPIAIFILTLIATIFVG